MKRVMTQTIRLLKADYVTDLLRRLVNRGLALRSVTALADRLCGGLRGEEKRRVLRDRVMKWKLKDAQTVQKKEKWKNTKVWREEVEVLRWNRVDERFFIIWDKEKGERRRDLKYKLERKVRWLLEKAKARRGREGERERKSYIVRGINVDDQHLDCETFESRPRVYGNAAVCENEASVLRLTPKFAVFDNVDVHDAECQIEKGLCKLRWHRMNNESPEEDTQVSNVSNGSAINSNISTRTRPASDGPHNPHNHSSGPHLSLSGDTPGASTGHSTLPSPNPINNPAPCPNPTPTPSHTAANDPGPAAIPIATTSGSRHWPYDPETREIDM